MRLRPLRARILFLACVIASARISFAQQTTVALTPLNPTPSNVITAAIAYQGLSCAFVPTTALTGSTVRTTVAIFGCFAGPPSGLLTQHVVFGPLPAGIYTYELYFQYSTGQPLFQAQQPLVVTAPPNIPTLSRPILLLLTAGLVAVAILALKRL